MDLRSPLDDLTNDKRRFGVFAIDHRDSLRVFVRPDDPGSLTAAEITDLKIRMVQAIAPEARKALEDEQKRVLARLQSRDWDRIKRDQEAARKAADITGAWISAPVLSENMCSSSAASSA